MRYGIACGWVESDPTLDLGFAMTPYRGTPRAAITDPREIGRLMKKIREYRFRQRRLALLFGALTFVRPGEIVSAEWSEFEWDASLWRIPAEKMKMKRPHLVPLARQTLDVLAELKNLTGEGRHLFPSAKNTGHVRPRSLNYALRSLGYKCGEMCAHGFRAIAATTLADRGWPSEVIERQLAHVESAVVGALRLTNAASPLRGQK